MIEVVLEYIKRFITTKKNNCLCKQTLNTCKSVTHSDWLMIFITTLTKWVTVHMSQFISIDTFSSQIPKNSFGIDNSYLLHRKFFIINVHIQTTQMIIWSRSSAMFLQMMKYLKKYKCNIYYHSAVRFILESSFVSTTSRRSKNNSSTRHLSYILCLKANFNHI